MNMNRRETMLALAVGLIIGGWVLLTWVIDPALAAFSAVDEQTQQLEQDLSQARTLVDNEQKIQRRWVGYERAGLSRSLEEADAQTGGALFAWAEEAGFDKINLSDGRARTDDEKPFGEITYTLQTSGTLKQVCDLLWSVRRSPFPLRLEKSVVDLRGGESEVLSVSLTVSTLFTPEIGSP